MRFILIPLAIASLAATGCVSIPSFSHTRTVSQTLETEPLNTIDLSTFNGSVTVGVHDLPTVDMKVSYKGYGMSEESARENCEQLDCVIEGNDGVLTVHAVKPSDQWRGSATFELKVPANCALKIHTSNGRVTASNVAAWVDVKTSNGTVTLKNVQGQVAVRTSNGTIDLQDCVGPINLTTSNGKVRYSGILAGPDNEVHTSNGSVTLKLAPNLLTRVYGRTSNGSIKCALPTQRVIEEGKRKFHAIIGDGDVDLCETEINLKTSNGSIKIEPLDVLQEEIEIDTTQAEVVEQQISL